MKMIGITGGVGSGKSELLSYIREHYRCEIVFADLLAKELQEPGKACYEPLICLLGKEILDEKGRIIKEKMADKIFQDRRLLEKVNALVHPAVTEEILKRHREAEKNGKTDLFFVEAALLIENGFDKICDELWYIYAEEDVRRKRLASSRGYSREKTDSIMGKQLREEDFRRHCQVVIDNSGEIEESIKQIDKALEEYQWQV